MDIPSEYVEKIRKWAEKYAIPLGELETELNENFASVTEEHPTYSEGRRWKIAYKRLRARIVSEEEAPFSPAVMYTAIFCGAEKLKNAIEQKKARILRMSKADQLRYHPDEDTWIDPNTGEEFDAETPVWVRTFYGIGNVGGDLDPKKAAFLKLEAWRDQAQSIEYEPYTVYKFRAISKDQQASKTWYLGATSATKLRPHPRQLSEDELVEFLSKLVENGQIKVFKTKRDILTLAKTWERGDPVFIEAEVARIRIRENRDSNIVDLMDLDEESGPIMQAYVPKYLEIDFTEGQDVLFLTTFGQVTFSSGNSRLVAYVRGFISLPEGIEI